MKFICFFIFNVYIFNTRTIENEREINFKNASAVCITCAQITCLNESTWQQIATRAHVSQMETGFCAKELCSLLFANPLAHLINIRSNYILAMNSIRIQYTSIMNYGHLKSARSLSFCAFLVFLTFARFVCYVLPAYHRFLQKPKYSELSLALNTFISNF